jgi:hypothetical protein
LAHGGVHRRQRQGLALRSPAYAERDCRKSRTCFCAITKTSKNVGVGSILSLAITACGLEFTHTSNFPEISAGILFFYSLNAQVKPAARFLRGSA